MAPAKGFTLLLTDAPGDFEAAVVTITDVFLLGNVPGGRISLLEDPVTVDLLSLQNDIATLVSGLEIPEGSYSQMRLVIDGAYIEVEGESGESRIFASSPDYEGLPEGADVDGVLHMPSFAATKARCNEPALRAIRAALEDDTRAVSAA